jgi:hypothetical protein
MREFWCSNEGVDLGELHEYVQCDSSSRWAMWLYAIRSEYRRLKAQSAERKT